MRKTIAALVLLSSLHLPVLAQTDENLLLAPWDKKQTIELRENLLVFPSASLSNNGGSLKLLENEARGRYRYDKGYELNPSVGFDWTYLNLDQTPKNAASPRLAHPLNDISLAIGSPLTKVGSNGFLAATAAIGYSGDDAFAEGRAWYGKGSLMYGYELRKGTDVLFLVDYNGNRSFMPDVPLPAFAYSSRLDESLAYVIGFPVNSLLWHPSSDTTVNVNFYIPDHFSATAAWDFHKQFTLFAGYDQRTDSFFTHNVPDSKRLFFREQRLEGGVRFTLYGARVEIAGGYAMGRSFDTGFDSRDLARVAKMSDEPYVRFNVGFSR